jgi:hypothetical protein
MDNPSSIPISLEFPPEQMATGFFFALLQILPNLPQMYQRFMNTFTATFQSVSPGSFLHLATTAVCLLTFSSVCGYTRAKSLAGQYFVKAIPAARSSLKNTDERGSDETLLGVVMLDVYDASPPPMEIPRSSTDDRTQQMKDKLQEKPSTGVHARGAAALVDTRQPNPTACKSEEIRAAVQDRLVSHYDTS